MLESESYLEARQRITDESLRQKRIAKLVNDILYGDPRNIKANEEELAKLEQRK